MPPTSALHSLTWLLWAVAATACLQLAPNPLYVAVLIGIAALVVETHRSDSVFGRAFGILVAVGVAFTLLRVVLLVLTTHGGGDAFLTLPEVTLPRLLGGFSVGGPLEWSVLWTVAAQGFVVVGVMAAFGAFNAVASHHELLQSTPRAFHEPGLVLTVALAFVPSTIATIAAVREADRARTAGRVVRRGRLVRLVIPVLETGLERAVDLADSMDARGFGRGRPTRTQQVAGWLGLGCLVGLGGTVVALVGGAHEVAALLALVGTGCLVAAVLIAPIGHGPTRYRPRRLTRTDAAVLVAVAAAPLGLGVCAFVGESSLTWVTTLPLRLPSFHVLPAACLALLASPALVRSPSSDPPDDDGPVAGVPVDADTPSYSMVGR